MSDFSDLDARAGRALQAVLRRTHLSSAADVATVFAEEARTFGVGSLVVYLVDYEQKLLVPLPSADAAGREPVPVVGTVAGRAFTTTSIVEIEAERRPGRRLWMPLLDGTERFGVMDLRFDGVDEPLPEAVRALAERYAHFAALMIAAKDLYSDVFEVIRRRRPMTVASELLWENVPPLVLASEDFVLSAMLEPCYDNGGDAFDYALNDRVLHFAVFDAMGHGLAAAGAAAFALALYRHSRRQGRGLAETYTEIDAALAAQQQATTRFVSGHIARLDVRSGALRWINAGHPPPLLLRDGRLVKTLDVAPSPPLGLTAATQPPAEGLETLEPGDMVLLYTDGLTEARRPDGDLFTVERLGEFIERQAANGQAAPETLRLLREAIIGSGAGALRDDATAVLLEWRRGTQRVVVPDTV
jgi:hypothetical protein